MSLKYINDQLQTNYYILLVTLSEGFTVSSYINQYLLGSYHVLRGQGMKNEQDLILAHSGECAIWISKHVSLIQDRLNA